MAKKHRARLRPKALKRKKAAFARSFLGMSLIAGFAAFFMAKPWEGRLPEKIELPLPEAARVERLDVTGAGEPLASRVLETLGFKPGDRWGLLETSRKRILLLDAYPALREVRVWRSWLGKTAVVELNLREPVARIVEKGSEAGYLDAAGARFELAAELVPGRESLPVVELRAGAEGVALGELGEMLAVAGKRDALPSPLVRLGFGGGADGWNGTLEDGTRVMWGSLEWTEEKLRRLGEVLRDAGGRFDGIFSADLRHFEDGKILVRPR